MKAAVLYGDFDLRLKKVDRPIPGSNEVLIKVKAAGICGSDLLCYRCAQARTKLGILPKSIMGHEFAGKVVEIGTEVTEFEIGDKVTVEPLIGCGECYFCRVGLTQFCPKLKAIGETQGGSFAEYTRAPCTNTYKIPDNISFQEAALVEPFTVGVHAMHRGDIHAIDTIAIIGGGTIGLSTLEVAKVVGAKRAFVIDVRDKPLRVAKKIGADEVINAKKSDPVKEISELTYGIGVDVVFECVGGTMKTVYTAAQIVRKRGKVVIIGLFTKPTSIPMMDLQEKEVNIITCLNYGSWNGTREFSLALNMLTTGKLDAKSVITHRFPLEQVKRAFEVADKKLEGAIKVEIIP